MKGSLKMENKCKRFLSLLLALVMVLGMMPVSHTNAAAVVVPNAKVLKDNRVVSLADCEYTYGEDSSFSHDGIYLNPGNSTATTPYGTSATAITVSDATVEGAVTLKCGSYYLHFHSRNNDDIKWNRCDNDNCFKNYCKI